MRICSVLVMMLALGCGKKGGESEPAPAPSPNPTAAPTQPSQPSSGGDPVAKAKEVFATRCTPCHGMTGAGDGAASEKLEPKPRAFSDQEWQKSVTDEHIEKIIKFGGAAVGKSAAMPSNPDLTDPAVVSALRDIVRSFGL